VDSQRAPDRSRGALLGLACGDALGTTLEYKKRGSFAPLTDMVGGGPFDLRPGEWTDDTSMALCLGESLLKRRGFDPADQIERYCRWRREGYWSSNGRFFDIGTTVSRALSYYLANGEVYAGPADPLTAGNGSITRLAPVVLFYAPDRDAALHYAAESSRVTHNAEEALDACRLLAAVLLAALAGAGKEEVLAAGRALASERALAPKIAALAEGAWRSKPEKAIRGSGYVVESLEASLWCFAETGSYREAVLHAANLGDDADTTAAVCGQIAGAFYGAEEIPAPWREKLARGDEIERMADALHEARPAQRHSGS
jgi:ADP-ribosyl-[dinitrogen reductase] hydrolase